MARKSEKTERFYEENNIERKKEWLKRYYHLTCDIADLRDEYERVSSLATSVTSAISKIRVKHSSEDKIQVAIEALSEIEEQIAEAAKEAQSARDEIVSVISQVSNIMERTILQKRYLLNKTFEEISEDLNFDIRWLMRIHLRALASLEIEFDDQEDCA